MSEKEPDLEFTWTHKREAPQEYFDNYAEKVLKTYKEEREAVFTRRRKLAGSLAALGLFVAVSYAAREMGGTKKLEPEDLAVPKLEKSLVDTESAGKYGDAKYGKSILDRKDRVNGQENFEQSRGSLAESTEYDDLVRNKEENAGGEIVIGNKDDEEQASFDRGDEIWKK